MDLTARQIELLEAIKDFRKKKGHSPTDADLAKILGVSTVRIHQQKKCLELAGEIKVTGKKSIQIADEIPYTERLYDVMKAYSKNPNGTQTEIANALGIKPPTLLQEHLPRLVSLGAIEMDGSKVKILDKAF